MYIKGWSQLLSQSSNIYHVNVQKNAGIEKIDYSLGLIMFEKTVNMISLAGYLKLFKLYGRMVSDCSCHPRMVLTGEMVKSLSLPDCLTHRVLQLDKKIVL